MNTNKRTHAGICQRMTNSESPAAAAAAASAPAVPYCAAPSGPWAPTRGGEDVDHSLTPRTHFKGAPSLVIRFKSSSHRSIGPFIGAFIGPLVHIG